MQANNREKIIYSTMKNRYVGLGNADTTRTEFVGNVKRDTYANLVGHDSTLSHLSLALGKSKREIHHDMIKKMANI